MITQPAITCTDCRAPLRDTVSLLFGVCSPCRDKWSALAVIGTPSRDGYTPQELRQEQNDDCEAYLKRVICADCGHTFLMDDAPRGPWLCDCCRSGE
jgi:hypothetical protein